MWPIVPPLPRLPTFPNHIKGQREREHKYLAILKKWKWGKQFSLPRRSSEWVCLPLSVANKLAFAKSADCPFWLQRARASFAVAVKRISVADTKFARRPTTSFHAMDADAPFADASHAIPLAVHTCAASVISPFAVSACENKHPRIAVCCGFAMIIE